MLRAVLLFGVLALASALAPSAALAVAPSIIGVDHQDRHVVMTFSASRASSVTVYFASAPDRGSDGRFLAENVKNVDFLTAAEIQAGHWFDSEQLDPGSYFVLLDADYDSSACVTYTEGFDRILDPSCADGFSSVVPLEVEAPEPQYRVKAQVYRFITTMSLRLTVDPLGERLPYEVCWKRPVGAKRTLKKKCVAGTVAGYSWNSSASDSIDVSTKGMSRRTKFTWYSRDEYSDVLASKTITVR